MIDSTVSNSVIPRRVCRGSRRAVSQKEDPETEQKANFNFRKNSLLRI